MCVSEGWVPIDGPRCALGGLFEPLGAEMRPGVYHMPNDIQEIAWAKPYCPLRLLDREIGFAAECVRDAKLAMRETRIRIELDCAS